MSMRIADAPTAGPSVEPVTITECEIDSRVDSGEFDDLFPSLIVAARQMAEQETGRKLITQTWRVAADDWPSECDVIYLSPYQSAVVMYWDGSTWATLATDQWAIITRQGGCALLPAYGVTWPTLGDLTGPRVRVDVTCGYGATAASVPESIRMWIRQHVAAMLRAPDGLGDDRKMVKMHWLDGLIAPHRVY